MTTQAEASFSLEAFAGLGGAVSRIADWVDAEQSRKQKLWRAIRPIPGIPCPQITSTNGTSDFPELMSPREGYWWDVHLAGAVTFSQGTVNLYRGEVADSQLVGAFTSAGYLTYGKAQLMVPPGLRLIFAAQSVTGNVTPSLSVTEIAAWAVPDYLL